MCIRDSTYAEARRLHGQDMFGVPSRFLREIPPALLREVRPKVQPVRASFPPRQRPVYGHASLAPAVGVGIGQSVTHAKFGAGTVIDIEGDGPHARVQFNFNDAGSKWLVLAYANLQPG